MIFRSQGFSSVTLKSDVVKTVSYVLHTTMGYQVDTVKNKTGSFKEEKSQLFIQLILKWQLYAELLETYNMVGT